MKQVYLLSFVSLPTIIFLSNPLFTIKPTATALQLSKKALVARSPRSYQREFGNGPVERIPPVAEVEVQAPFPENWAALEGGAKDQVNQILASQYGELDEQELAAAGCAAAAPCLMEEDHVAGDKKEKETVRALEEDALSELLPLTDGPETPEKKPVLPPKLRIKIPGSNTADDTKARTRSGGSDEKAVQAADESHGPAQASAPALPTLKIMLPDGKEQPIK